MQTPPALTTCLSRFRAVALGGVVLATTPAGGAGQPPAPVSPTVPAPAIAYPAHHPRANFVGVTATGQPVGPAAEPGAGPTGANETAPELSLGECIAVAIERQPRLRAVQSSQQATLAGQQALNNLGRLAQLVRPDLPIRREQSQRGVIAAAADVQQQHNVIVQDVTRMYYTAVFARQQEQLAADVVAQVELFVRVSRDLLNSPAPGEMTKSKLDLMVIGLSEARYQLARARNGQKRALAALREAMGVKEADFPFRVKDTELPVMAQNVALTKEKVVCLTLDRRPELALAAAGADAFRLEVYAQGMIRGRRSVPTLAAGADIHSRLFPSGNRDPGQEYRPEPIPPEMPPNVVGSQADRVNRTMQYSHRADAAFETARNLMVLEAEKTFFDFELAAERVKLTKESFEAGKDLMERIREGFDNPKAPKEQLLAGYAQAAQAQAAYVEAVLQYLVALAALERVTAGGIRPAFPGR